MQKFGVLYLQRGMWEGKQLLPTGWVEASFTPWIRSKPHNARPDYGWFWWTVSYGKAWTAHEARGWKGQRIVVIPEQQVVVTMTSYIEDGSEETLCSRIIEDYVVPSVYHGRRRVLVGDPAVASELSSMLEEARKGPMRGPAQLEPRMIPSVERKGFHADAVR
jgi:hypothetical protein